MKITKYFKNEMENLEHVITKEVKEESCIKSFSDYIKTTSNDSIVESKYIEILNRNLKELLLSIYIEKYSSKSKKELLEDVKSMLINGIYGINNCINTTPFSAMVRGYDDKDLYMKIKEYMESSFITLTSECESNEIDNYKTPFDIPVNGKDFVQEESLESSENSTNDESPVEVEDEVEWECDKDVTTTVLLGENDCRYSF